jgi:hypothetical protein
MERKVIFKKLNEIYIDVQDLDEYELTQRRPLLMILKNGIL